MRETLMLDMIDMNVGNLRSVSEAFTRAGASIRIAESREQVESAEILVLPGVGAFRDAMDNLRARDLVQSIRAHVLERARPLLGICVGMQILASRGVEHGVSDGLDLIPGEVIPLAPPSVAYRVPHMGWCDVTVERESALFPERGRSAAFYFAHSFHLKCHDERDRCASFEFGAPTTAAVARGNVFGLQFHPEKSQDAGIDVLSAFITSVAARGRS